MKRIIPVQLEVSMYSFYKLTKLFTIPKRFSENKSWAFLLLFIISTPALVKPLPIMGKVKAENF